MIFNKKILFVFLITLALAGWWWKNSQRENIKAVLSVKDQPIKDPSFKNENSIAEKWRTNPGSPEVVHQIQVLNEILASQNDNDPRMDSELKKLNSEAKLALREKYSQLPETQRNARGTIVFLIGRNLAEPSDYQFLKQVVAESPCLGLADCSQPMLQGSADHEDNGLGVVLDYPQLTALKALASHPAQDDSLKSLQAEVLQIAKASRSSKVSEAAEATARNIK